MFDLKRMSTTVLGLGMLILCAVVVSAETETPQLVITSARFDEANSRLVITGQNLSRPSNRNGHSLPPSVTLDLLPLTVLSATSTEIVASLAGTFPDGTYLITVSRGLGVLHSGAFAVAIYHEQNVQGSGGSTGPKVRLVPQVLSAQRAPSVLQARPALPARLVQLARQAH